MAGNASKLKTQTSVRNEIELTTHEGGKVAVVTKFKETDTIDVDALRSGSDKMPVMPPYMTGFLEVEANAIMEQGKRVFEITGEAAMDVFKDLRLPLTYMEQGAQLALPVAKPFLTDGSYDYQAWGFYGPGFGIVFVIASPRSGSMRLFLKQMKQDRQLGAELVEKRDDAEERMENALNALVNVAPREWEAMTDALNAVSTGGENPEPRLMELLTQTWQELKTADPDKFDAWAKARDEYQTIRSKILTSKGINHAPTV